MSNVFIIAEAGVNHNGSRQLAIDLIDVAAAAGADAVKFQTFRAEEVISRHAAKAAYQARTTDAGESQLDMVRKLQLSEADHEILAGHAKAKGIAFMSTPFDLPSLRLLTGRLAMDIIKVPSGEITNAPLLVEVGRTGRRVILSTGMSTLGEVETALAVLAFGYLPDAGARPTREAFMEALASEEGQRILREKVSLLHCTTEYPAPVSEVNLKAMDTLAGAFGLPVGLSDHTMGIHVPVAAVARGARIVEKHFTLDRKLPGPDHPASLEPAELSAMVAAIRDVEAALGDGVKVPTAGEWGNRRVARKSLVALRPIAAGQAMTAADLGAKRPGTGLSPLEYWNRLGRVATRDYETDDPIE